MKKITGMILVFLFLTGFSIPAAALESTQSPDGEITDPPHVHSFDHLKSNSATCGEAGVAVYQCSCGEETQVSSQPTGNHTYGGFEFVDTSNHKKVCTVCAEETLSGHGWDAGRIAVEANCKQDGEQVFTCADCGGTYSRKLPKTGHNYDPSISDEIYHVCSVCQSIQSHAWNDGEVTRRPTCLETGTFEYYCSICEMTLVEPLARLTTHTYDSACDADCNVCGATRAVEHTFTTAWSKNYKGHWHECTKCGEQKDFASHNAGPEATEDQEQVCLTCKYVVTPKKNHVHKYQAQWSSDEVGHWHECSGCKHEKDYAAHVFDNACDPDCNTCSFQRENAHDYEDKWQMSNFEHWQICSLCGEESIREKHIPGPEASDEAAQVCTVCSFELEAKQAHTHDFGDEWYLTDDSHWQSCSCGELSIPTSHVWIVGKENRNGTVTYICDICGMEKEVETGSGGISGMVLIIILLVLVCIGGIAALVIILKRKYDEPEWTVTDAPEMEPNEPQEEIL